MLRILGARSCGELESFVSRMAADALQDRSASGGPSVAFACGVWSDISRPLKPAFREAVVGTYKAEASTVNFRGAPEEARGQINAWAAQVTRNLIRNVLHKGSINPATTRVVLCNAVYFKGKWEDQPFDRRHTMHEPFYRLDRSQVDVPFMQSTMSQFVAVHDGFKVLKLRHLPEQQIALREFRMPKFKLSFHSSIVAVLKKLGLELPFCERGNLSDMVEDDGSGMPIVVGDVIHKAVVEVNEEGTEAAAVTVLVGALGCARPPSPPTPPQVDFIADHPFAYYIVEEATGAVVFAGHVLDPSKE
nr:putative serpin-Z8 [Aegilops tauschii subsp. strangulata]